MGHAARRRANLALVNNDEGRETTAAVPHETINAPLFQPQPAEPWRCPICALPVRIESNVKVHQETFHRGR